MIDYEAIEDAICLYLKNQALYDIKPLPDNEAEFTKAFVKPMVYLAYNGSDYGEPENLGGMIQEETLNFDFMFRVNTRRGTSGLLTIIKTIGDKILGYKFQGFNAIRLTKQGYVEGTGNNWNYIMSIQMTGHVVENLPEPETVYFKVIDFIEEGENQTPLPEE